MLVAHISDLHVFADKKETSLVRSDAVEAARKVVADISNHQPPFDGVIITGDLVDGESEENYSLLSSVLDPLNMPIAVVPGNHDGRAGIRSIFSCRLPFQTGPYLNYEFRVGKLRILALDTLVEGQAYGALVTEQLVWLGAKLQNYHAGPTAIVMHHPPFFSGITSLDEMSLRSGRDELAQLVTSHDGPLLILAGHIHRPYQVLWNGALGAVGSSPSFQYKLKLSPSAAEPETTSEPYSYFVLRFDEQETITIHKRHVTL